MLLVSGCLCATGQAEFPDGGTKTFRGFADINFTVDDAKGTNSGFRIGEFDTYITGTLAERTSFLSEVTYKYSDRWIIGFERLWVRHSFGDHLRVSAGKFHTPLGYWNRTYHHGVLLYTSIDKPQFQKLIPIHTLGIRLSGREIGWARLYYSLMIGNGIGSSPTADNDQAKSLTFDLHSKVIDGVDWGLSVYRDHASKGGMHETGTPHLSHFLELDEDVDVWIVVASGVVEKRGFEVLTEFALVNTEGETSGKSTNSKGGYILGSYELNQYVPYVKLDYLKVVAGDLLYEHADTKSLAIGINYHLSHLTSLKVQYTSQSTEDDEAENRFATQLAIGF